jgi:FkbM family methyltransferase
MDKREGVIWAYRYILNREPESDKTIDEMAAQFSTPLELRRLLRKSSEFASYLDRADQPFVGNEGLDWRAGITWAYRLFRDRDPTDQELTSELALENTVNNVRLRLLLTGEREFRWPGLRPLADFSIINAFAPFPERPPIADAFQDILGSVTRVEYLGNLWSGLAGYVYRGVPRMGEQGLHGTAEWIGTFRSVLEAGDSFEAMELGAGWAPWLIVCKRAAERRGLSRVKLTGVEGSEDHYGFMLDNFRTNGVATEEHSLHHAVAGAYDGVASFPKLKLAHDDYGANAVFSDAERPAAEYRGDLEEIRSISLATLLADKERVDLIHIDIQGHEEDVLRAGIEHLNAKVRRMVIGTHSRAIEGHLFDLLHENGWKCEFELPCSLSLGEDGRLYLTVDGEQVWRNDRLPVLNPQLV